MFLSKLKNAVRKSPAKLAKQYRKFKIFCRRNIIMISFFINLLVFFTTVLSCKAIREMRDTLNDKAYNYQAKIESDRFAQIIITTRQQVLLGGTED